MKLKRVLKSNDDWQKCCRWCHYYQNGMCYNNNVSVEETAPVYKVAEEGYLSETIEEFFEGVKLTEFHELEYQLREWKISEKRVEEFKKLFKECYDQWVLNHKEELDEVIDRCYQNHMSEQLDSDGVYINDPENYCCKDWC